MHPEKVKFTLDEIYKFICEYTDDLEVDRERDVMAWYRWFASQCAIEESRELMRRKRNE